MFAALVCCMVRGGDTRTTQMRLFRLENDCQTSTLTDVVIAFRISSTVKLTSR